MQNGRVGYSAVRVGQRFLATMAVVMLAGCAGPSLEDYRDRTPRLVPEQFFEGELSARGVDVGEAVLVIR